MIPTGGEGERKGRRLSRRGWGGVALSFRDCDDSAVFEGGIGVEKKVVEGMVVSSELHFSGVCGLSLLSLFTVVFDIDLAFWQISSVMACLRCEDGIEMDDEKSK